MGGRGDKEEGHKERQREIRERRGEGRGYPDKSFNNRSGIIIRYSLLPYYSPLPYIILSQRSQKNTQHLRQILRPLFKAGVNDGQRRSGQDSFCEAKFRVPKPT